MTVLPREEAPELQGTGAFPMSPVTQVIPSAVPPRRAVPALMRNGLALCGGAILVAIVLFCFVGPLVYPTDQTMTDLSAAMLPPSAEYPLGTDEVGHDVLGRLMVAGQVSLYVGLAAAAIAIVVGTLWGAVAGYFGGVTDAVMMRTIDIFMSIPALFLLVLMASIFDPSLLMLILVVAAVAWLVPARLIRGDTLTLRSREYVASARGVGAGTWYTLRRHILPNAFGTISVNATFQVADAILAVATISFLGLGLRAPATDWGGMLSTGVNYIYAGAWWLIYPAGIMIVATVLAFNFIGEALDDSLGAQSSQGRL